MTKENQIKYLKDQIEDTLSRLPSLSEEQIKCCISYTSQSIALLKMRIEDLLNTAHGFSKNADYCLKNHELEMAKQNKLQYFEFKKRSKILERTLRSEECELQLLRNELQLRETIKQKTNILNEFLESIKNI